ncbi:MAG: subclass B3 metallo-beta-lactamase [Erythrobacter sp.]
MAGCAHAGPAAPLVPEANRTAWAAGCEDWDEWDKPAAPYRIHGSSYYVGTCGISAILIVGESGLVLIDTGTEPGSKVIEANIAALGFAMSDVKAILTSHEHYDHVGGLARLQQLSGGAPVFTSAEAAPVLRTGKDNPRDPQAGLHDPMRPVTGEIRTVADGEKLNIAGVTITGVGTPGHTLGAMSWQWESCESERCVTVVFGDSLTAVSSDEYRFTDHPEYVAIFRRGIERLAQLDCELLLTPHPSASGMPARLKGETPWIDAGACRAYAEVVTERLDGRLAKEAEAK